MARGGRLPRAAARPPRFLRTGHRCAIGLSEAHLRLRGRDARHTLEGDAELVLESLCSIGHRGTSDRKGDISRPWPEGDPNVDAALASAMGCSPLPRSLTPPRPPLSDQRRRCCARLRRCPDCPRAAVSPPRAGRRLVAACSPIQQSRSMVRDRPTLPDFRGSSSGWTAAQRPSYGPVGAERIQRIVVWGRCQIWALRAAELGQSCPGRRSRAGQAADPQAATATTTDPSNPMPISLRRAVALRWGWRFR
jgi:hypothetical protein